MIQDLRKVLKLSRLHSLSLEGRLQQSLDEHRTILAAIKAGQPSAAETAMHDHLLLAAKPGEDAGRSRQGCLNHAHGRLGEARSLATWRRSFLTAPGN